MRMTLAEKILSKKLGVEVKVGEILLTSIDANGHRSGYDIQLTQTITEVVDIPVIA